MLRLRLLPLVALTMLVVLTTVQREGSAQPLRFHVTGAAAKPVSGHQKRELDWGGALKLGGELAFSPQFGVGLEVGGLYLSDGKPPRDVTLADQDQASALWGALALQARPFNSNDPFELTTLSGLWLSASFGTSQTGGLTRLMMEGDLGYDVLIDHGSVAMGPTVGLHHVFQPDEELRPSDANILLLGLHVMFDTSPKVTPDRDEDGLRDSVDHCPDDPEDKDGFEDHDGCPDDDNDEDGIPDRVDDCPNVAEDKDGYQDRDGCPDEDNDEDGIVDAEDQCPDDPEDKDGYQDRDGCPDEDNDEDGIVDAEDLCPNEPETVNNYADHDGCPDTEQIRVMGDKIVLDDRVYFRTNSASIRGVSYPLLGRLAQLLLDHPQYVHIEIQGHADQRGPAAFNEKLSQRRADSVMKFLVKRGVEKSRLSAVGFGSERLRVPANTARAWFLNRRVEFLVTRRPLEDGAPNAQSKTTPGRNSAAKPGKDPIPNRDFPPRRDPPPNRGSKAKEAQ